MDLPVDVLLALAPHLPLPDLLVLRRTSKSLHAFTRLRPLWARLFRTHVIDQHLPFPDVGSLADLDAARLEALTRRAVTLRRAWSAPRPVPARRVLFATPTDHPRVIFLQFLPARSNRWLISVRTTPRPRSYLLQCWDVAPHAPRCVAELTHADGPYGGVVLNSDPSSPAVLAMQSAQTETFSVRFDAADPECGFVTEATIDGVRELHLLAGSTLVTRRTDNGGALSLWDLGDPARERIQLLNPSLGQPDDRVHAVHLAHDYALVARVQSIEIYSTLPRPNILAHRGPPIAYPLAQHKFQWRTDAVVMCPQPARSGPPPVHLLVRFGSTYPWPVNVLHHYRLAPNPAYGQRARRRTPPPTPTAPTPVTSEYDLPYDLRPHATRAMGSPVRLFAQSAMALGPYGTALWIDNHVDESLGPSERGQRLAGVVVPPWSEGDETNTEPTSAGSMLFGVNDNDGWTRVAMAEQAGRIALGQVDGAIALLEY